jgi:hypothetical protein
LAHGQHCVAFLTQVDVALPSLRKLVKICVTKLEKLGRNGRDLKLACLKIF